MFDPGEEGYKAFRIPGMLAFKDVLMVFAEGRKVSAVSDRLSGRVIERASD